MPRHTKPRRTRKYLKRRGRVREAKPRRERSFEEQLDIAFMAAARGKGWFFKSPSLSEDQEQK